MVTICAEFKEFVQDNLTFLKTPIRFGPSYFEREYEKYKGGLETFFRPGFFVVKNDILYVTHYRLASHKRTGNCIFFDPMTFRCAIYGSRPKECQMYPFNFEYNFQIDKKITVFITEKCSSLESSKPLNKPSLESTIKNSIKECYEQNKLLHECGEKLGISAHLPYESFQKRELRKMLKEKPEAFRILEEINISKTKTKISEVRDILLEEQAISCLNVELYRLYLSELKKKEISIGDWI